MRGADLLIRSLATDNIERIFTLSGNQIMSVFDACLGEEMQLIHVRHEAAAVHMADAWARLTGKPGIALVTAGPGFANALSALYVALMSESPLVLVSGASPHSRAKQAPFQEMPQAEMAGHVTKASWTITDTNQIGHDLARAIRIAKSGRPGPVHLCIPADVLVASVDRPARSQPSQDDFLPNVTTLEESAARAVLDKLAAAERPLILAGTGLCRLDFPSKLRALSETLNIPVVPMRSPRGLKGPDVGRFRELLPQADVVLLLSRSLDFTLRFGESPPFRKDCRFLIIDSEMRMLELAQRNVGETGRIAIAELADAMPAIEQFSQLAGSFPGRDSGWRKEIESAVASKPSELETHASPPDGPIHPAEVCRAMQPFLDATEDSVFIADGGEFGQWMQACVSAPHRLINGNSGGIGNGLPFALAARYAFPESRVLTAVGDGTFGFHAMEFETAVRYKLPFVAVVGNDARWNAEHQIQLREFGPDRLIGCELNPTRYDEVVTALGGHGEFVTRPEELSPALQRAFDSGKPACVNVMIEPAAAPE